MHKTSKGIYLSVSETVEYLKRTSQLTVLVEGKDDQCVYRHIENKLSELDLDVLICNGRQNLLDIFSRRMEFSGTPVVFLADKDMWHFTGIPAEFNTGIIFTLGYSIENDLYLKDVFEELMSKSEKILFSCLVDEISRWQAFHVEEFSTKGMCNCDFHVNRILQEQRLSSKHLEEICFKEASHDLVNEIKENYTRSIRGKTLFQMLARVLSASDRESKYSRKNLIEMGAKLPNNAITILCNQIRENIKNLFKKT
ncbi:DUF4435 domain-containing protein [Allofranklinella schreckenbergeri]|uniref:DUF4435 domain-containing protein n=1 Tax=Allofranklinella schreckenbergeri TaxID=1076744 RepID=UPI001EEECA58|nr:DUF4435 domain-containing protein [Allofranklinella schreckenbergeri]